MTSVGRLAVGCRVHFDGKDHVLSGFDGDWVHLSRGGRPRLVMQLGELVAQRDFRLVSDDPGDVEALGPLFDSLSTTEYAALRERESHVREVLTGYRSGSPDSGDPGEPRPPYAPAAAKMSRYAAKAAELGVAAITVRRWATRYEAEGIGALIDGREHRPASTFGRVDPRWIDIALEVLAEEVPKSQPTVKLLVLKINLRVRECFGGDVPEPSASTAGRVLASLAKGRQAFAGASAKQKRSIAGRPATPYGRRRATQPGQYVLLDTTKLDIFGMDRNTLRWVRPELTIAMCLATRRVLGLRLSGSSTKSIDIALVLYEAISPNSRSHTGAGILPYGGVPQAVLVADDPDITPGLPGTAVQSVVTDHGKVYISRHMRAVCQRMGISIEPARVHRPTDKPQVERFFKTLSSGLLDALPGYTGPDVYSRGRDVEKDTFYFLDELEGLIRDWIVSVYHRRTHEGLHLAEAPRMELSPDEMWRALIARSGELQVPWRPDLAYDFLPVVWTTIQHYGVQIDKLKYDGECLNGLRDTNSPHARMKGKWPFRRDPDDVSRIYFQRPWETTWHTLRWTQAEQFRAPFSRDTLQYARTLMRTEGRRFDDVEALVELLNRWGAGLMSGPVERRIALRASEQWDARLEAALPSQGEERGESLGSDTEDDESPLRVGYDDEPSDMADADYYQTAWDVSE